MSEQYGWRYYNHAVIPTSAPHEEVNLMPLQDGSIWRLHKGTLFARWTSDFDCGYETNWWYTIIDRPFDIMSLKSDYRRRIRIGMKNYSCRIINPEEYAAEMARITLKDWDTYPEAYRPDCSKEKLIRDYISLKDTVWGAFDVEDQLSAFQIIEDHQCYLSLGQGKSDPEKQKLQVNAALITSYLDYYADKIQNGIYISNGTRNILHQTNFNEDLCKKYGFRKAYCHLNIVYRFPVGLIMKVLYPFRNILKNVKGKLRRIYAVLQMEEIARSKKL